MAWYDPAFSFKKSFVIPHGNVSGGSDLLDFPLLLSFTDSALKSMDNGGLVASSSGYDFLFTDGTETRELPYEVESYTASSGALICWVRIPVLSASQDTLLYLYFGNGTVTGFQAQASNVWDKNYLRVYHMGNGSTLSVADSTSNVQNGTNNNTVTATTGQIDGGASFNGTTQYVSLPTSGLPTSASAWTISMWEMMTSIPGAGNYPTLLQMGTGGAGNSVAFYFNGDDQLIELGVASSPDLKASSAPMGLTFYHLAGTYNGSAFSFYVNGVLQATRTITLTLSYGSARLGDDNTGSSHYFAGTLDEVHVSNIARSASWIATEYANQSSPSSFVWIGETIPYAGNVDEALIVASSVTTAQSSLSQINVDSKGAIVTINVTAIGVSETFALAVKGKDGATGQAYTIASFPGIGLGASAFTVYPGVHDSSTATSAVLPHVWYVTVTPSTSDTSSYTVGASLLS